LSLLRKRISWAVLFVCLNPWFEFGLIIFNGGESEAPPNKTKNAANDGFAFRFIEGI